MEIVKALLEREEIEKVYLACRDFEAGTALCCGELWDLGGDRSEAVELDVSDGESIKRAVDYVGKTLAARDDGQPSDGRASVRFRTPGTMVSVRFRSTATRPTLNVRCAPAVILPRMFRVTISVVRSYLAVTLTLADVAFT